MKTDWVAHQADTKGTSMRDRLANAGVFADADAFFDALEAGADVLGDHVDPVELVDTLRLQRPS